MDRGEEVVMMSTLSCRISSRQSLIASKCFVLWAVLHERPAMHQRLELGFIDDGQFRQDILSVAQKVVAIDLCSPSTNSQASSQCQATRRCWLARLARRPTDSATSPSQRPSTLSAAHCRCCGREVVIVRSTNSFAATSNAAVFAASGSNLARAACKPIVNMTNAAVRGQAHFAKFNNLIGPALCVVRRLGKHCSGSRRMLTLEHVVCSDPTIASQAVGHWLEDALRQSRSPIDSDRIVVCFKLAFMGFVLMSSMAP